MSITALATNLLNILLLPIGVLLIAIGIWRMTSPNSMIFLVEGIAFSILGVWNIIISILNIYGGVLGSAYLFIIVSFIQLIWGIQNFKRYKKYSDEVIYKPTAIELENFEKVTSSILKAKAKTDEEIITFRVKAFGDQTWKCRLFEDKVVILINGGVDFHIVQKEHFEIIEKKKAFLSSLLATTVKLQDRTHLAYIEKKYLERFKNWKNA